MHLVCVWEAHLRFPNTRFAFSACLFFFFLRAFQANFLLFSHYCGYYLWTVAAIFNFSSWIVHGVRCSRTHKLYFSAIFSLKMGPTIRFTHLKIILLQCFSIFSFQLYPNGPLVSCNPKFSLWKLDSFSFIVSLTCLWWWLECLQMQIFTESLFVYLLKIY